MNRIIGIIPARINSKRLKRKNLFVLNGKPLIMWTIYESLKSKYVNKDNLYVSTESDDIKEIVSGTCKVIDRTNKLAKDHVWTQDVIDHASSQLGIEDDDIIVILQANSPEIEFQVIDEAIEKLIKHDLYEIHTVDENLINNGAIHVLRGRVSRSYGKVNYNSVIKTNWIDVHTIDDVEKIKRRMKCK